MPFPLGFVPPCLPTKAPQPPTGDAWLHEIKHDGFRVIARKDGARVRLYSRPGNDLTYRFPLIVKALARLRSRSCIIDGEAVCCDDDGRPSFDRIRYRRHDGAVFLYAFDLIELNGAVVIALRDPLFFARRRTLTAAALASRLPTIYAWREPVDDQEGRATLVQMAQVWLRLAKEQDESVPPSSLIEEDRPVVQQQQQVQPKSDDKKGE
jgi:bifunctional non-homologous end joining protein LigD